MVKLVLATAVLALTATASNAVEIQCSYYGAYSKYVPWYADQEIYECNQGAAERSLDYNSRGGTRRPSDAACNRAIESGMDPDAIRSYGCRV
jgi:hypothetical protein